MKKKLKKIHEHYREHYFNEEVAERIKVNVHQTIRDTELSEPQKKQEPRFAKRLVYVAAACLVLFGLFVGSAFVSPAMADVASKIPFLNKIFEQRPVNEELMEILRDEGYDIASTGYAVQGKKYHITVAGTEEYYNRVKEDVKRTAEEIISLRGYDSFTVVVEKERTVDHEPNIENDPKYKNSMLVVQVLNEIIPKLQQQGYKIHTYGIGSSSPDTEEISVDMEIEDTEKRTDDIEIAITEAIEEQNIPIEFTVEFRSINLEERALESKWTSEILPVIWEGMLSNKEFKTKGVGYSYKMGTMNIFITTTIDESDNKAPELANKIETAIHEFLQSEDLKTLVGDTPYKVVVRDKDSKDIQ
ncbi:DUF4030 domain-containing protein [Ornithinibacillus californiensis]|uniref:DUF4030 domain-containing protein n=1 Tax=Ornithinibacillus californiensis TaxID=161536 RepID=UPI00064DB748|nr:DUF4030 domain-containing protein [Ornithinibacillus californiensis]